MFDTLRVYDDHDAKSAAMNMAVDEALLADASEPILRFYRWRQPSLSFGYFGLYAEAVRHGNGREIIRRWTGGGIVPHGDDVTYSVIVPRAHPFLGQSSLEIYAALHDGIRRALQGNRIPASLLDEPLPRVSEDCFANAVRADVMSNGRKIAGAAHRRSRCGLLHQGSIQQPALPEHFRTDLAGTLCKRYEKKILTAGLLERAAVIAATKYGTAEWLMRR